MSTPAEIDKYNERELLRDFSAHIRVAEESIEHGLGVLEDLGFDRNLALYELLDKVSQRLAQVRATCTQELSRR